MLVHTIPPPSAPASDGRGQERWVAMTPFPFRSLQFLCPSCTKVCSPGQCPGPGWTRAPSLLAQRAPGPPPEGPGEMSSDGGSVTSRSFLGIKELLLCGQEADSRTSRLGAEV